MTSPCTQVEVRCPQCHKIYQDWYRASVNLSLDNFDDNYLDQCSSAVCPHCGFKVYFDTLTVTREGEFVFRYDDEPENLTRFE